MSAESKAQLPGSCLHVCVRMCVCVCVCVRAWISAKRKVCVWGGEEVGGGVWMSAQRKALLTGFGAQLVLKSFYFLFRGWGLGYRKKLP